MVEIGRSLLMQNMLRPRTIIPAGDSITIRSSSVAMDDIWQYNGSIVEVPIWAARDLRMLRNAGVSGNTAAQLEARLQADVIAYGPDACLLLIGTNNFVSGMASSEYAVLMNSVERMVRSLLGSGILPIIVTPPPKNGAATEAKRAQPFYYWLAEYYGLPLIDLYRILVDPTNGSYASGYSDDGTHPNAVGIAAALTTLTAKLTNIPALCAPAYLAAVSQSAVGDLANMIRNGAFALGTAPSSITGWTTNTTNNTNTLENPVLPQTGKVFKAVLAADGGIYGLNGTDVTCVPGNRMIFSGQIDAASMDPATDNGFQINLHFSSGGNKWVRPMQGWKWNGSFFFSEEFVVPSGVTTLSPQFYIQDIATYQVSNLTLIDRTALGAIWTPGVQAG